MKRIVKASAEAQNRNCIISPSGISTNPNFTPTEIVNLLQEIEELNGLEIFYERNSDGNIVFTVGNNVYADTGFQEA